MPSKRMVPEQEVSELSDEIVRLRLEAIRARAPEAWCEARWQSQLTHARLDRVDLLRLLDAKDAEIAALKADLDAATATFDDEQAAHQDTLRLWQQAKAEIVAITEQRDRAMKALQPFADATTDLFDETRDTSEIWELPCAMNITAGDLRRAQKILDAEAAAETDPSLPETPEAR